MCIKDTPKNVFFLMNCQLFLFATGSLSNVCQFEHKCRNPQVNRAPILVGGGSVINRAYPV